MDKYIIERNYSICDIRKMNRKIMPPTYFMVLLVLSVVLYFGFPIQKLIPPPYTYLGILLILFGFVLNLRADALFKKSKTTVKPHETPTSLEISGPFRISRHPMYLGMAAILLGVAIVSGSFLSFLFPIVFVLLMELLFIPIEEKNLKQVFGTEYRDYKKKVRRWI